MNPKGKPSSGESAFRSPLGVAMVVVGLAVIVIGPYLLYRLGPLSNHGSDSSQDSPSRQAAALDGSLDVSELDSLPQNLHDGALLLLTTDDPELPDSIANLPEAMGENLLHPVSEAVEETQPVLYWQPAAAPPPYSVTVLSGNQIVARAQGIQDTSWMVPVPLVRGAVYTWLVSSGGASERASFRVIDDGQLRLWRTARTEHPDSPLVTGTVAQQLGMLGVAEREYSNLAKANPNSAMAARLLNNVTGLRER